MADPPWPMVKIARRCRPKQRAVLDYPTMSVEEIALLGVKELSEEDAHLYLWTTHRYLPDAFRVVESWGFKYECLFTWIKPVGFTPFSWMRTTEFALFCRRGSLPLKVVGKRLDLYAGVGREHSRKPDAFLDIVEQVSPGPYIEVFARRQRFGWDSWGDECRRDVEMALSPKNSGGGGRIRTGVQGEPR